MKALLLGSNGQLGTDIRQAAAERGSIEITAFDRAHVDLSDLDRAREVVGAQDFDVLINCASYHKTDEVESNAALAARMNGHLVRDLAEVCRAKGARFVHFSTDYVFGGQTKREPLTEEDRPSPLSVYGASKLLGEGLALTSNPDSLVLRVSSLFGVAGASGKGGNFVETMIRLAKQNGGLKVVDDQHMAPTGTQDIAEALLRLLEAKAPAGLYHVAGTGATTWHGFARRIVERAGLDVPVEPVPTSAFPTPARRPPYSVLDAGKLGRTIGWTMPAWEDALDRYLVAKGHRAA